MQKKVGIILINYKDYAERFLKESYESIVNLNYPKNLYKIYIVDNESTEESREVLTKIAPDAVIVPDSINGGWGQGNNVGIEKAIEQGYDDYFAIINMDTIFDPNFLTYLIAAAESDSKIGIAQSKVLLHPPKEGQYYLNSKGNTLTFLGFGYCLGEGEKDDVPDRITEIVTASGAGMLIKKDIFLEAGMCDPTYFMYHDDIELSLKVKLLGYKIVLAPKSVIYHKYIFKSNASMIGYMERNRLRFLLEFYKIKTILLIFPALVIMEIGMIPFEIKNKWFIKKLKVYLYFFNFKNLKIIHHKRKQVQKLRKISDKEMLKGVSGTVDCKQVQNILLKYIANPLFNLYWEAIKKILIW